MAWLIGLRAQSPWLDLAGPGLIREEPNKGVGVLDTSLPFEDCWSAVPKNMRDSIRKARRKIDEAGGCEVVVVRGGELAAAFERFVELEGSGWKAAEGGALARLPAQRALWRDYLTGAENAQIRFLYIADRLAAAQITVTTADTLFLPKIAFSEDLARFAPSNVLMADLLEACCTDPALARIDCLAWQPWHPRWGITREPTYALIVFNHRTLRGLVARAARGAWGLFNRRAVQGAGERPTRRDVARIET